MPGPVRQLVTSPTLATGLEKVGVGDVLPVSTGLARGVVFEAALSAACTVSAAAVETWGFAAAAPGRLHDEIKNPKIRKYVAVVFFMFFL